MSELEQLRQEAEQLKNQIRVSIASVVACCTVLCNSISVTKYQYLAKK